MRVWTLWLQGRKAAPAFVQHVFHLWEALNPDCQVSVLEQADADRIFAELGIRQDNLSPQVRADFVRTWLLANEGGVWVDATLLPTQPLNSWLPQLVEPAGFFAHSSPGDPNLVLQNWFLAAAPGNALVQAWLEEYTDYFRSERRWPSLKRAIYHRKPLDYIRHKSALKRRDSLWFVDPARGRDCLFYPYAVHNYCLARILRENTDMRALWDSVPFRSADIPLVIGRAARDVETPESQFFKMAAQFLTVSPLHKLNHRDARFLRVSAMVGALHDIRLP